MVSLSSIPRCICVCLVAGVGLLGVALPGPAAAEDGPGGSAYRNDKLGVSARSPSGWKMVVDESAAPTSWKRLVTFNDKDTDAQAVLSVRPRTASSVSVLSGTVRKAWEKSAGRLRLDSIKNVEPTALEPIGKVIVEGSFTREPPTKPAKDGVAPPPSPPIGYRVTATYLLGPGYEYLLYAQGQRTHWSRLRAPLRSLAASIRFSKEEAPGPKGEGSYRNDAFGFSCVFPKTYTVVTPQRTSHLVSFEGVGEADPVLSVYAFTWEKSADEDARRLVAHYEEDKGGSVSRKTEEVSGQEAVLLTARATLSGVDRTVLLAIFKRGDTCFRLRASVPQAHAANGEAVFAAFLRGFRLSSAPK